MKQRRLYQLRNQKTAEESGEQDPNSPIEKIKAKTNMGRKQATDARQLEKRLEERNNQREHEATYIKHETMPQERSLSDTRSEQTNS